MCFSQFYWHFSPLRYILPRTGQWSTPIPLHTVVMKVFPPSTQARAFPFIKQRVFGCTSFFSPFKAECHHSDNYHKRAAHRPVRTRGAPPRSHISPRRGPRPTEAVQKLLSHYSQPTSFSTMSSAVYELSSSKHRKHPGFYNFRYL